MRESRVSFFSDPINHALDEYRVKQEGGLQPWCWDALQRISTKLYPDSVLSPECPSFCDPEFTN
jgi:hypothetical protein